MFHRAAIRGLMLVALLTCVLSAPHLGFATVKLFLKNGTYQVVSSYEVRGDRVRYYSLERSEWEEIPTDLVDFEATRRAEEKEKTAAKKALEQAKEIQEQRFEKPAAQGMEIAPGIRLPGDEGVFTLEGQRLVRMVQSSAEVITDKKRAALTMAVPLPVMKGRSLVVLDGAKAAVRLTNPQPTFYVQSADGLGSRLTLVRIRAGKDSRVVEQVEGARAGIGKGSEMRVTIPLERSQVATDLYKLKPSQPLESGEYVLGELLQAKLNLDLWDFGVDKWEVVK